MLRTAPPKLLPSSEDHLASTGLRTFNSHGADPPLVTTLQIALNNDTIREQHKFYTF